MNRPEHAIEQYHNVYFVGIGGIGMSALARYFKYRGLQVCGYDLTPSEITEALQHEGISVTFSEKVTELDLHTLLPSNTLVVYTPAVPQQHEQLTYFRNNGYRVCKRAEALGLITAPSTPLCVAGTHGKTTTSTMLAHFLCHTEENVQSSAFLGGVSNNYGTNFLYTDQSDYVVIEADEFDRSFHYLSPQMAIITSTDPDHLDIYGDHATYLKAFEYFASLIRPQGVLLSKQGLPLHPHLREGVVHLTYGDNEEADVYYDNVRIADGKLFFDWHFPARELHLHNLLLGVPVRINVENTTAAMAIALLCGVTPDILRSAVASFAGSHRRFERVLSSDRYQLIDDYAHHPSELEASISSVCELYSGQEILGIFQPHLYSRTADFYKEFAHSLSRLNHVVVLDIYPAREEPIPGVTSQLIFDLITSPDKHLLRKEELLPFLKNYPVPPVVLMLGAGNIDRLVKPVRDLLQSK